MSANNDGFLSRWSQRKAQVRESAELEADAAAEALAIEESRRELLADPDQRETPPDDETRQRWIDELEQVDVDALSYDSDFTIFMKDWVPGALRKRALRKLWSTNPALAVLDGLNDYDLDYTDKAVQAGTVISSWSPDGGYKKLEELVEKLSGTDTAEDGAAVEDEPVFEEADAARDPALQSAEQASATAEPPENAGSVEDAGTNGKVPPVGQPS